LVNTQGVPGGTPTATATHTPTNTVSSTPASSPLPDVGPSSLVFSLSDNLSKLIDTNYIDGTYSKMGGNTTRGYYSQSATARREDPSRSADWPISNVRSNPPGRDRIGDASNNSLSSSISCNAAGNMVASVIINEAGGTSRRERPTLCIDGWRNLSYDRDAPGDTPGGQRIAWQTLHKETLSEDSELGNVLAMAKDSNYDKWTVVVGCGNNLWPTAFQVIQGTKVTDTLGKEDYRIIIAGAQTLSISLTNQLNLGKKVAISNDGSTVLIQGNNFIRIYRIDWSLFPGSGELVEFYDFDFNIGSIRNYDEVCRLAEPQIPLSHYEMHLGPFGDYPDYPSCLSGWDTLMDHKETPMSISGDGNIIVFANTQRSVVVYRYAGGGNWELVKTFNDYVMRDPKRQEVIISNDGNVVYFIDSSANKIIAYSNI